MHILAATDFSTRSQRAVRRAGLLARAGGADLTLVHVVDDDQPPDLIALASREAERILDEQIGAVAELRGLRPRALVVEGDPFDGILRAAASAGADLIVMGAHRKQLLLDVIVGTTIERVIRTGPFPVLMGMCRKLFVSEFRLWLSEVKERRDACSRAGILIVR